MDLWRLLGYAKTTFHHHEMPIAFESKDGTKKDLLMLVEDATPPCQLNPFLFNGHIQTFWTAVKGQDIPIYYKRKIFEAEDQAYAGTFEVDFVVPENQDVDELLPSKTSYYKPQELDELGSLDSTPMLVTLHGLSGGSHEIYLRHVLVPIIEAGWEACVVNSRGCARSKATTGVLYNARSTWDIRQVVGWLRKTFPNRPLFGLGFSLGANVLVNYLGEEGSSCVLRAAVVCSCPWNLDVSNHALQRSWLGREIYSRAMASSLKTVLKDHKNIISSNSRVDVEKVLQVRYLHEFDRELQCPTWGYPTVGSYYRDASSTDSLLAVKIPLFALNAEDDPIVAKEALPFDEIRKNPYTVMCSTTLGGHLSWFESGGGRWFAKPASRFLISMAKEVESTISSTMSESIAPSGSEDVNKALRFEPMRRKLLMAQE